MIIGLPNRISYDTLQDKLKNLALLQKNKNGMIPNPLTCLS